MKFIVIVRYQGKPNSGWEEPYDKPEITSELQAERWARRAVNWFNETLRPHEQPREYVGIKFPVESESEAPYPHDWVKVNAMTIRRNGGGTYDIYRCSACRITGKRFGLGNSVTRDSEFRSKGFEDCNKAKQILANRQKRKALDASTAEAKLK